MSKQTYDILLKDIFRRIPTSLGNILGVSVNEDTQPIRMDDKLPRISFLAPDLIFKDKHSNLIHVEIQSNNDNKMLQRMLLYYTQIFHYYKSHNIIQYVLYVGDEDVKMENSIMTDNLTYSYNLVDLKTFPCEKIIQEHTEEEILLVTLCNIGKDTLIEELKKIKGKIDKKYLPDFQGRFLTIGSLRIKLIGDLEGILKEAGMPITIDLEENELYKKLN